MKTKNKRIMFVVALGLAIGFLIAYSYLYGTSLYNTAHISSKHTYTIIVDSKIINTLNSRYTQDFEQLFCVYGTADDVSKTITINNISENLAINSTKVNAYSQHRYECEDSLGSIHTHPRFLNIIPECSASTTDFYYYGEISREHNVRLNGVYCSKNIIAFYLSNTETDETLFRDNYKIGYTLK